MPLPTILSPFLNLVRSPLSTAPITSAALSSIHAFFASGIVSPNSPELRAALSELSNTISHCKFDAGGNNPDEAVIFRIIFVVRECICGPVGHLLGDMEVCEMLETVLTTCCQVRLGGMYCLYLKNTIDHKLSQRHFAELQNITCMTWSELYSDA
jgi:brefeldin A-resistance guanine nucleotide exchange factor 1